MTELLAGHTCDCAGSSCIRACVGMGLPLCSLLCRDRGEWMEARVEDRSGQAGRDGQWGMEKQGLAVMLFGGASVEQILQASSPLTERRLHPC